MLESLETRAIPKLCGPLPCKEKDLTKEVLSPQCLPISPSGRRLPNAHLRRSVTRAAHARNALSLLVTGRVAKHAELSPIKKGSRSFPCKYGAGKESRTLDLNLGKVALYQLSYSRICLSSPAFPSVLISKPQIISLFLAVFDCKPKKSNHPTTTHRYDPCLRWALRALSHYHCRPYLEARSGVEPD